MKGAARRRADLRAGAGFLRIMDGDNPLDRSAVHPEAYPVVARIASGTGLRVQELVGKYQRAALARARGVCRRGSSACRP